MLNRKIVDQESVRHSNDTHVNGEKMTFHDEDNDPRDIRTIQ